MDHAVGEAATVAAVPEAAGAIPGWEAARGRRHESHAGRVAAAVPEGAGASTVMLGRTSNGKVVSGAFPSNEATYPTRYSPVELI